MIKHVPARTTGELEQSARICPEPTTNRLPSSIQLILNPSVLQQQQILIIMGNDQGNTAAIKSLQQFQTFMIQYSKEREYDHPQFGLVKLYDHNQTNETILLKRVALKSSQELDHLAIILKKRKNYDQPNLLRLLAVRTNLDDKLCSDASQVIIITDCYLDTLEEQLQIRAHASQHFQEAHIWLLIQQVVDCCAYLEEKRHAHGDLRPLNIYLDPQGNIKLAESNMLPGGHSGFQKILYCKDRVYLSPLLLKAYTEQNFRPNHNKIKSDVYVFGLTLLHVLLLEDSFDCLDFISGAIQEAVIHDKLQRCKQLGYSQLLLNFVREILSEDESLRPLWSEVRQLIEEFREQIVNLVPFYNENKSMPASMVISQSILRKPAPIAVPVNIVSPLVPIINHPHLMVRLLLSQLQSTVYSHSPPRIFSMSPAKRTMYPVSYKEAPQTKNPFQKPQRIQIENKLDSNMKESMHKSSKRGSNLPSEIQP